MLRRLAFISLTLLAAVGSVRADVLDQVQLVADATVASSPLPLDSSGFSAVTFTVPQSGNYTIAVVDLGAGNNQALGSLAVSVATSTASIAQFTGAASKTVALNKGTTYTVQPLATAANGLQGGSLSVTITPQAGGATSFQDVWAVSGASAPPLAAGESNFSDQFKVSTQDTYTLTLTDLNFPGALSQVDLVVLNDADGSIVSSVPAMPIAASAPPAITVTAQLSALPPGTYDIYVVAQASGPLLAGLYGLQVVGNSAGVIYAKTEPVGALPPARTIATLAATDTISLQFLDVGYPLPLNGLQGVVAEGATVLQQLPAAGLYQNITAGIGTPQLYVWATVGNGGQGAYTAYAYDGSGTLLDTAQPVVDSTHFGYALAPAKPVAADQYHLGLNEYAQLPAFADLSAAAVQQGTKLATADLKQGSSTSTTFTAKSGPITIVVFPTLAAVATDSLFGVDLVDATTSVTALNATQGVGALFSSSSFQITTTGTYLLQATDLQFPATLSNFYVILTSGQSVVAQILLGGQTTFAVNASGTYVLNVLTEPGSNQHYGQYGISLTQPAAPTVTLSASPTSVSSGGTTTLTWSSTNATSCKATGAWSADLAPSGSQLSAALSSPATFDLSCTGPGGNAATSVQVAINASKSGGGGSFDDWTVLALLLSTLGVMRRRVGFF